MCKLIYLISEWGEKGVCHYNGMQNDSLLKIYNVQYNSKVEQSALYYLIDSAIKTSSVDESFPLMVFLYEEVTIC